MTLQTYFLDQDIILKFNNLGVGYHTYTLSMVDQGTGTTRIIYTGQVYCATANEITELYLSDIINNNRYIYPLTTPFLEGHMVGGYNLWTNYIVSFTEIGIARTFKVYHAYRYPNNIFENFIPTNLDITDERIIFPLLQTTELWKTIEDEEQQDGDIYLYKTNVLPHYPWISTDKYGIPQSFYISEEWATATFDYLLGDNVCKTIQFQNSGGGNVDYVDSLANWYGNNVFADTLYIWNEDLGGTEIHYFAFYIFSDIGVELLSDGEKSAFINTAQSITGYKYPFEDFLNGTLNSGRSPKVYLSEQELRDDVTEISSEIPYVSFRFLKLIMANETYPWDEQDAQTMLQSCLEGVQTYFGFTYTANELAYMLNEAAGNNTQSGSLYQTNMVLVKPHFATEEEGDELIDTVRDIFRQVAGASYSTYFTVFDKDVDAGSDVPAFGINVMINQETVVIPDSAIPVAKIDKCPARYYVMWQDRLGGIQSQPFEGKDTYSESLTYNALENYKNHMHNYNVQVQPQWQLNTGWIKEYEYPIYESILISPYVLIYDTLLDKSFMVIPSDKTYTEKTWKNQKRLFNISYTFELDKPQNILA